MALPWYNTPIVSLYCVGQITKGFYLDINGTDQNQQVKNS